MKSYIVGGACRDKILNISNKDTDYVVVGSTIEEMFANGFQQVGCDFPVFIHPETGDEYALARTEKKTGNGYQGFTCDFNSNISLEQDLKRRDFSINSIAFDEESNTFVDPCNGVADIHSRIIRHTGSHFAEDPVRILRAARFLARYHKFGFTIHPDTMQYMKGLVNAGGLQHLTKERIVLEMQKACTEDNPELFFEVIYELNGFNDIFGFTPTTQQMKSFYDDVKNGKKTFERIIPVMYFYVNAEAFNKFMSKYTFPVEVKNNYIRCRNCFPSFLKFHEVESAIKFYNLVGAKRYNHQAVLDFYDIASNVCSHSHLAKVSYTVSYVMQSVNENMKKFTKNNPTLEGSLIGKQLDKFIQDELSFVLAGD